tara:strand:+ start:131 stop:685 length:555 start_codon:yes stop_codon:yes gene_type:complete
MKPLLITILEEAKKNKVMFRHSAYDHWNNNNPEDIYDWGYDIPLVIEMIRGYDGGNVEFIQAKHVNKDNKKIVNMKRLQALLKHAYPAELKNNAPISYACDTEFEHYGITIGEGDIENITSLDECDAVEYLFDYDASFEWEPWNITQHETAITNATQTGELAKVFDIIEIEKKWLKDLVDIIYI